MSSIPSGVFSLSRIHALMFLKARDDMRSICQSSDLSVLLPGPAVAQGLTERVQGTSAFLFGWADSPNQRGLAQRRKEMGWFKKMPDLQVIRADLGPQPQRRFGLTGEPELKDRQKYYPSYADVGKGLSLKARLSL